MSHDDFTRELYLHYIKLGNNPEMAGMLTSSAMERYFKLITPPTIKVPKDFLIPKEEDAGPKLHIHKGSDSFLKFTNDFIPPRPSMEEKVDAPSREAVDKLSAPLLREGDYTGHFKTIAHLQEGATPWSELAGKITPPDVPPFKSTDDGGVTVVVLKEGGGTEVVPLTLDVVKSGRVLWQELKQAGIQTQEQLNLFIEDFNRSQETREAIRACGKPDILVSCDFAKDSPSETAYAHVGDIDGKMIVEQINTPGATEDDQDNPPVSGFPGKLVFIKCGDEPSNPFPNENGKPTITDGCIFIPLSGLEENGHPVHMDGKFIVATSDLSIMKLIDAAELGSPEFDLFRKSYNMVLVRVVLFDHSRENVPIPDSTNPTQSFKELYLAEVERNPSREILVKGRSIHNGEWVEGYYVSSDEDRPCIVLDPAFKEPNNRVWSQIIRLDPSTLSYRFADEPKPDDHA